MKKPRTLDLDGLDGIVKPSAQLTSKASWPGLISAILLIIVLAIASFMLQKKLHLPINAANSGQIIDNTGSGSSLRTIPQSTLPAESERRIDQQEPVSQSAEISRHLDEEFLLPKEPTNAGYPVSTIDNSLFTVHFEFDSSNPIFVSDSEVDELMNAVSRCHRHLRITGYTCNMGSTLVNRHLGLARANAVKQILMNHGIGTQRIETVSAGETDPIASNATSSGRAKNRRAELKCLDQ